MTDDSYKLSDKKHEIIFSGLERRMLDGTSASLAPKAVIIAGQPGAGKSALIDFVKLEFATKTVAVINGDQYRESHPQSKEILHLDDKLFAERTDPDVRVWTRRLFESAIKNNRNIIFEGTMRQPKPLMETIAKLKQSGYMVEILAMAVKKELSELGIIERYEDQKKLYGAGRWTPPLAHDAAYANMPNTLEQIESTLPVDRIRVYTRSLECLYDNRPGIIQEERKPPAAKLAVLEERARPLPKDDLEILKMAWARLAIMQAQRCADGEECLVVRDKLIDLEKAVDATRSIESKSQKREGLGR
jgi:adenylate kinase family enzyme